MFRRPSIRSSLTTLAAAAVLVGGAGLASYAATGHASHRGHTSSAAPKSYQIVLTQGKKKYTDSAFVTATVPHGAYQITLSGKVLPTPADASIECSVSDKRYWTTSNPGTGRRWADDRHTGIDTDGTTLNAVGAATIKKGVKVAVGCIFGVATWTVDKPIVATLTRVKSLDQRPTHVFAPDRTVRPAGD